MSKPRVLLVAYQCGPEMGSVSQIGWEWYWRLSHEQRVTLVTHVRNKPALQAAGAPFADSEIIYIDTEWFAGPLYRAAKRIFPRSEHAVFLVSSLDYFVFDLSAYRRMRALSSRAQSPAYPWEVLHRVTPVTLAAPTLLGRLGLPMVIGPLNSGLSDPSGFPGILRQESTWLVRLRALPRLLDALIGSTRRAARVLVASRATRKALGEKYSHVYRPMLENGVDLDRFHASQWPASPGADHPLRILFAGRLIPVKGVDMLLQAVARLQARGTRVQLDIVGDGPLRNDWEALAKTLGLSEHCVFHGNLKLDDVAEQMRQCHVFCLPSIRESGGAVLLEAMACARPVVALNFGGPAEIVDSEIGALLPMENPEQVTCALVETFEQLVNDPDQWRQKGKNGRERVERQYSWAAKIGSAQSIYREMLREQEQACS